MKKRGNERKTRNFYAIYKLQEFSKQAKFEKKKSFFKAFKAIKLIKNICFKRKSRKIQSIIYLILRIIQNNSFLEFFPKSFPVAKKIYFLLIFIIHEIIFAGIKYEKKEILDVLKNIKKLLIEEETLLTVNAPCIIVGDIHGQVSMQFRCIKKI